MSIISGFKTILFTLSIFQLVFDRDPHEQRTALGHGTYGKVYVAHDRYTWKKFAVKEIPMRNPVYTDVLENEIKILSTLSHKNSLYFFVFIYKINKIICLFSCYLLWFSN